jgi:hypothetical protein
VLLLGRRSSRSPQALSPRGAHTRPKKYADVEQRRGRRRRRSGGAWARFRGADGISRRNLTFLSLKRAGTLIYSRFRVCDDYTARVKITEHDSHPGVLGYTRYYAVSALPCKTYARHWGLAARFRHGAYTATLQASDRQGAMSPKRSMTLHFPAL